MRDLVIRRFVNSDVLAVGIADQLAHTIVSAMTARGVAHVVLTGGRIGTACLVALRDHPLCADIPWDGVEFWWSDERFVPTGDPERNDTGAFEGLLNHYPIPAQNIHPMPSPGGAATLDEAAVDYWTQITAEFGDDIAFDVCLLGVGEDAHVASLFPSSEAVRVSTPGALAISDSPKPPPERLTFTRPLIEQSRQVWLLASGTAKADAVHSIMTMSDEVAAPASNVRGSLRTVLFLDDDAAARIEPDEDTSYPADEEYLSSEYS